nr:FHA domain-containing protein [uncultured Cohaesibacter sp.]
MNDENRTRIIRPRPDPTSAGETQKISPAEPEPLPTTEKTRVISNFGNAPSDIEEDGQNEATVYEHAVGWLVVIKGPGKGCSREIYYGMNSLGRGPEERIPLDFGDASISREAHAFVTFDEKQSEFYISHGGKSNLVRLNDAPVLAPQLLKHGDRIEIGQTELMFVPLCGEAFNWTDEAQ